MSALVVMLFLFVAATVGTWVILWWYRPPRNREIKIAYDPNDPDDPMSDPSAREMMKEVIRTGRAMHMRRGEPAQFVDENPRPKPAKVDP